VLSFWIRALTFLNNFTSRYRMRTFNYRNHPINWMQSPCIVAGIGLTKS